jgi:hypothetical protein
MPKCAQSSTMPVLLVAYDVHPKDVPADERDAEDARTKERRSAVRGRLTKTYPENRKLSESAYAIETSEPGASISFAIWQLVEQQDEFYVIPLSGPPASQAPPETTKWLRARLPR